jgi:hypothetical protein
MRTQKLLWLALLQCTLALPALGGEAPPKEALVVVKQVHEASTRQQLQSLAPLMSPEFTWSFGGDASAEQALQEWRARPKALQHLSRVTASRCEVISGGIVQCPAGAKLGYRAGFKQFPQGWLMVYFVAGD